MANGHTCRHISICIKREKEDEEKIRAQYMRVKNEMIKEAKKGAKNSSCPEAMYVSSCVFINTVQWKKISGTVNVLT